MPAKLTTLISLHMGILACSLIMFHCVGASLLLQRRQRIPPEPVYVALSAGPPDDLTLLKRAHNSRHVVTAGPADSYTTLKLPPSEVLLGEFVGIRDNAFVPDNKALRRPFETWEIGIIKTEHGCLRATLDAPYITVTQCQEGVLNDTSLTWINWGFVLDRGLGGYIQPYGNQSAKALYNDVNPWPGASWGLEENQEWRSTGKPPRMALAQGSHITILKYNLQGPVANQTVGF